MAGFIKETFTALVLVLLGFGGSLDTKCVFMYNQPCMVRPTLTDLIRMNVITIHLSLL